MNRACHRVEDLFSDRLAGVVAPSAFTDWILIVDESQNVNALDAIVQLTLLADHVLPVGSLIVPHVLTYVLPAGG